MAQRRTKPSDHVSQRARIALDELAAMAQAWLQPHLTTVLDDLELRLFGLAEHSRSDADERLCLDSLSLLRARRSEIPPRFLSRLQQPLVHFGDPRAAGVDAAAAHVRLELLATDELEENIALADIAARSESRSSAVLFDLAHRFAVLIASPVLDVEQLPLGPYALGRALQYAAADIGLPLAHRIELYRRFDQKMMMHLDEFYNAVNQQFIGNNILPNLRGFMPRAHMDDQSERAQGTTPDDAPSADGAQEPPDDAATQSRADGIDDSALFAALSELLAEHRQHNAPQSPSRSTQATSNEQLHHVLANLQTQTATTDGEDHIEPPRNMAQLRQDMLTQLRQLDPQARTPHLAAPQLDVIELMTMLFDRIDENIPVDSSRHLLSKVQAPLLRVALDNHDFFTEQQHPARRWLNSAAEACARWGGEGEDRDPALLAQLQSMVTRINAEFSGDPAMFDAMRADIDRQVDALERKAQITERRYVEASKGRERLQIARGRATQLINERLADKQVSSLTRAVLQQAWADLLALTLLRQGEDSETFNHQLQIVDALSSEPLPDNVAALCEDVEHGLTQVGMPRGDARQLARKVTTDATDNAADEPVTRTELALKLKQRKGMDAQVEDEDVVAPLPLGDDERRMLQYLQTLAFGTWFEVDGEPPAPPARRKMAWYSIRTGRCLLVNQRGARADTSNLDDLARAMVAGSIRLQPPPKGSLLDRAWEAIVARVKALAGSDTVTPEAST